MQPLHARFGLADAPLVHAMPPGLLSRTVPDSELDWLRPIYDVRAASSSIDPACGSAGSWQRGIKLNIAALRASGVSDDWLVRLEHGFTLGLNVIPSIPASPPDNYSSLAAYGSLVQAKCDEYLKSGVLEEIPVADWDNPKSRFLFHPMGAVPKGLNDCRLIMDVTATGLNSCIKDTLMRLLTYRVVLNACKPGYVIFGFDLSSGFHHLFVALLEANLLCIITPDGKRCRFRYICFGLKIAPFLFQGFMMEIRRVLINLGILPCFNGVYIDDWSMVAPSVAIAQPIRLRFKRQMGTWGCVLNDEKEQEPSTVGEVSGICIDTVNLRIFISRKKCDKAAVSLEAFLLSIESAELGHQGRVLKPVGSGRLHDLDKVVGKLCHLSQIVFGGRLHLQPIWDAKAAYERAARAKLLRSGEAGNHASTQLPYRARACVRVPDLAISGLRWWRDRLRQQEVPWRPVFVKPDGFLDIFDGKTFPEPWSIPTSNAGTSKLVVVTTDASASGYGFVVGDPKAPVVKYAGIFSLLQSVCTSNWRESKTIEIAYRTLLKHWPHLVRGAFIIFRTDNTSAASMVNKGTSRSFPLRQIARNLFELAASTEAQIAAMHVAGSLNTVADGLSREAVRLYAQRRLSPSLISWLQSALHDLGLDLAHITDVLLPSSEAVIHSNRVPPPSTAARKAVVCSIPPPATTEASLRSLAYVSRLGYTVALLLSLDARAAADGHRWWRFIQRLGLRCHCAIPNKMVVFEHARLAGWNASYNSRPLELNVRPQLFLWLATVNQPGYA